MTGLELARTELGGGPATPLMIAHGLFGSARNWGAIQKRLADHGHVVAVDMRNHGLSPWDADHTYKAMAEDLARVAMGWDVVGHSMGGKAAMTLALTYPRKVRRLVVADIAPVAYSHTQMHLIEAMQALDLSGVTARSEADARLAAKIDDRGVRAFLLQSLDVRRHSWRLNLDALADQMPAIMGFPKTAHRYHGPTLILSGAASDYVRPEHRKAIRQLFPQARFAKLQGAGHWLHADKPREFAETVRAFLDA